MSLYHVTSRENAIKIYEENKLSSDLNRNNRQEMHKLIDRKANQKYSNWCNRKEAIFAWSSFEKAKKYSRNFTEEGILEVELRKNANPWCIENFVIEDSYHQYLEYKKLKDEKLNEIIEYSRKWNGETNEEIEVWFKKEDVKNINAIYDSFGNQL